MENALLALNDAVKVSEGISALPFHSLRHVGYASQVATEKDIKWVEERRNSLNRERTVEMILEDMDRVCKLYAIQEYNPIIQKIQVQYKNISDQINLYKEQIKRYGEGGNETVVKEKKQEVLDSYKEEEAIIESEIHSYEQTIEAYTSKLQALQQEEATLRTELESVQTLISHYTDLKTENQKLEDAISKEKERLNQLQQDRRRTLDNMLTEEEAQELEKQRIALEKSERLEAELMVEVEKVLKGMDSSLMSVSVVEPERSDLEKRVNDLTKRHSILQHVCEEFVNEVKDRNDIARAMQIVIQNGGEMTLNDLKSEMKRALNGESSTILPTIYSLVGNQIFRIDRSGKEQKVICMI